jgi:hypothetical protein
MRNSVFATLGLMALAFIVYLTPSQVAFALTTTSTITATVTGYAIPNAQTLGVGGTPFVLIIAVLGLFVGLSAGIKLEGSTNSFVIKLGLFVGCLLGMLSLNSTAPTLVPVGFPVVAGVYMITYVWKGV